MSKVSITEKPITLKVRGMDDTQPVATLQHFFRTNGIVADNGFLKRMDGKALIEKLNSPIVAIHATQGIIYVQTAAELRMMRVSIPNSTPPSPPIPPPPPPLSEPEWPVSDHYDFYSIPYVWNDLSVSGSEIAIGNTDDAIQDIGLPFSFPFFGSNFGGVGVSSNGYVSLDNHPERLYSYGYGPYPSADVGALIGPLMMDLVGYNTPSGRAFEFRDPNFIGFQWQDFNFVDDSGSFTFQLWLYSNGEFDFVYNKIQDLPASYHIDVAFQLDGNTGVNLGHRTSVPNVAKENFAFKMVPK